MPWLNDSKPNGMAAQQWKTALRNAFSKQLSADRLETAFRELGSKYPASSAEIANVLLGFRSRDAGTDDPLLFTYSELLLRLKLVRVKDLLVALLDNSRFMKDSASSQSDNPSLGLPTCEERMFNVITELFMTEVLFCLRSEVHDLTYAVTRWMQAVTEYEMGRQLEGGALYSADIFSFNTYEALASLALTILSNGAFRNVGKQPWWKKRRASVVSVMESFDSHVLQWMQSQLGGRLRNLTAGPPFLEIDDKGRPIFSDEQILQSIQDLQMVNSRAGLYIWLNACLWSRPLTENSSMFAYLQARYSGNMQALIVDFLTACFDVLTNVLLRKELEQSVKVVRSFICNKVPVQLAMLSGVMAPATTIEACIQMAFSSSIAMDVLPPISEGATETRDKLKLTRQDFLYACALHGLVSDSTIAAISEEPPRSSKTSKYTKEGLIAKYANNVGSFESLIEELNGMNGNVGAVAGCIIETINNLCLAKDTISLKNLCNMLIKRIPIVDIVLQYTEPVNLLSPLCTQLNNWVHDQDQMEFTPAYEEFASILLFILAVVHRYGLESADLGLQNNGTFVSTLLQQISVSKLVSDLTPEQKGQLEKWIEALYSTDEHGETGGISDEVMRPCPPQAFYQLVPTLFEQSVIACKSSGLSMKAFKGGLELLVEPFLLPSLVGGLSWLIKHSWEDHDDADILLQVLDKLLKPSSSSQDTNAMHKAILCIVANPLHHSLENLHQRRPEKKEVRAMMDLLKPFLDQDRTVRVTKAELDQWMSSPGGGIPKCLRGAIQDQIAWISNVGPTPPPKYTHRLFTTACETSDLELVLNTIVAELKEQTINGNGSLAMDVCTALLTAPVPKSAPSILGLNPAAAQVSGVSPNIRDALQLRFENLQGLLHGPAGDAEAIVRLTRRVDAQLATTQMPQMALPMPMQNQDADQLMADLGLTDGATGADASLEQVTALGPSSGTEFNDADLASVLDQPLDLSDPSGQNLAVVASGSNGLSADQAQSIFDDLNLDTSQSLAQMQNTDGGTNNGEQNAEDEIWADLDFDMTNMDDFIS